VTVYEHARLTISGGPVYWPGKLNKDRNKLFSSSRRKSCWLMPPQQELSPSPLRWKLQGNFSQSVQTNGRTLRREGPADRRAVPKQHRSSTRIDPNMQKVLGVFPAPNFFNTAVSGRQYNYVISDSTSNPRHQKLARMDYDPYRKMEISIYVAWSNS